MNILVTGGAGFIGSHLNEYLLQQGHRIDCLDNFNDYYDPEIKRRNISFALQNPSFKLFEGDILDIQLLSEIFHQKGYDVIVHLAARAGVRPSIQQPLLYQEVNVRGTMNLLEMAKTYGVKKFIFASSSSVYGNNKKLPFSEKDFVDCPVSPYAATKRAGEIIAYTYHHLYNISVWCLRFFTVYGPRQRPDMAIHKFTDLISRGKPVPLYGDGNARRDFTYITDIIQGVVAAIERCNGYNIYNLGESRFVKVMDVITLIEDYLGKKAKIEKLPPQMGDVPITYADIEKARRELGYNPIVSIEEGLKKFITWYKEVYPI
ncbi:MAG: GDP-mannose 4,6-dehydratase [candidate division KSB1 bacterium]|nr:GDP-mannose 4,6-dehydratase [candidate division KSB1 bacterium]